MSALLDLDDVVAGNPAAQRELAALRDQVAALTAERDGAVYVSQKMLEQNTYLVEQSNAPVPAQPAAAKGSTHCDECGCDWLDNGLNPVGCPYCKRNDDKFNPCLNDLVRPIADVADIRTAVGFIFGRFCRPEDAREVPDDVVAAVRRLESAVGPDTIVQRAKRHALYRAAHPAAVPEAVAEVESYSADLTAARDFRIIASPDMSEYVLQWQITDGTIMTVTSVKISSEGLVHTLGVIDRLRDAGLLAA